MDIFRKLKYSIKSAAYKLLGKRNTEDMQLEMEKEMMNKLGTAIMNSTGIPVNFLRGSYNNLQINNGPLPGTMTITGNPSTPSTSWMRLAFDTDERLFRKYVKRMRGKLLMCTEHVEGETFVVPKEYALRYIYQGLKGKLPDTDVDALDDMTVDDEIHHIRFEWSAVPCDPQDMEAINKYIDTSDMVLSGTDQELDAFMTSIHEEQALAQQDDTEKALSRVYGNGWTYATAAISPGFVPMVSGTTSPWVTSTSSTAYIRIHNNGNNNGTTLGNTLCP